MDSILMDLYFGELDVNSQKIREGTALHKATSVIDDSEKRLIPLLDGKEKSLFLDYVNAWGEVHAETATEKFALGFKVGARMTLEALTDDLGR